MNTIVDEVTLNAPIQALANLAEGYLNCSVQVEAIKGVLGTTFLKLKIFDGDSDVNGDVAWSPPLQNLQQAADWIRRRRTIIDLQPTIIKLRELGFEVKEKENGCNKTGVDQNG